MVDWYGVGVLLYEMLTGCIPYDGATREELFKNILSGPLKMPINLSKDV